MEIPKKKIMAPQALNEPIQYEKPVSFSRGISVDLKETVMIFISGTASVDHRGRTVQKGDVLLQSKRTFNNLSALLRSAGATWHDVLKTTCYLKDMRHYDSFNKVRNAFYKKLKLNPFPASTCIQTTLCRPDLLVEIELIAVIEKKRRHASNSKPQ
jgi:2-iminobutanoate/2-iminopropanoate deaminase